MRKVCAICGNKLELYRKSNYALGDVTSYSFASRKVPEYMHWDLYECRECRILFSECPIENEGIFEQYEQADYDSSEEADMASETYFKYLERMVPDYPKGVAMDIGTGNGSYLLKLKNGGVAKTVGVEPSKSPVGHADDLIKGDIVNAPFSADLFDDESFDMISLFQTIEHIPDTMDVMRDIKDKLKPGGIFYMVCHDYRSPVNRVLGLKSPIYDIEHLQIFSKKGVRRLMKKVGYKEITVFSMRNRYPIKYWARLFPFPKRVKKKVMAFMESSYIGKIKIGITVGNIGVISRK